MNVLCVLVVNLAVNTWGLAYFHLDNLPPEFGAAALNTSAPLTATTLGGVLVDIFTSKTTASSVFSTVGQSSVGTMNNTYFSLNYTL